MADILNLGLLIYLVILTTQLILALISRNFWRHAAGRHNFYLSSQLKVVELLQKYSRLFGAINIRVNANIQTPAEVGEGVILINRDEVYSVDAFANFYVLCKLELLTQLPQRWLRISQLLPYLFIVQLMVILPALLLGQLTYVAAILAAFVLALGLYLESLYVKVTDLAVEKSLDLLDLTTVEQTKMGKIADILEAEAFLYPFTGLGLALSFLGLGRLVSRR